MASHVLGIDDDTSRLGHMRLGHGGEDALHILVK